MSELLDKLETMLKHERQLQDTLNEMSVGSPQYDFLTYQRIATMLSIFTDEAAVLLDAHVKKWGIK